MKTYHKIPLPNTLENLQKSRILHSERPLRRPVGENSHVRVVYTQRTHLEPARLIDHIPVQLAGDPLTSTCLLARDEVFSDYGTELDSAVDVAFFGEEFLEGEVDWVEVGF